MKLRKLPDLSKVGTVKKYIVTNKAIFVAVAGSILVAVPTTLYITEKNKERPLQQVEQAKELTNTTQQATESPASEQPAGSSQINTPSTNSTNNSSVPTNKPATTDTATPAPTTPTRKSPFNFTFSSGNRTAQWYAGGTYFPGNGYTDEWVSATSAADARELLNLRLSYNCSSGPSCPSMIVQGSNNGTSWINYKTLSGNSGTVTYPILYSYYRLLLASGNCSSNACPPPTPPFPITYELSASGYFYN